MYLCARTAIRAQVVSTHFGFGHRGGRGCECVRLRVLAYDNQAEVDNGIGVHCPGTAPAPAPAMTVAAASPVVGPPTPTVERNLSGQKQMRSASGIGIRNGPLPILCGRLDKRLRKKSPRQSHDPQNIFSKLIMGIYLKLHLI